MIYLKGADSGRWYSILTGFRRGFSTGSALLKLRDDIKRAMNAGEISIIVLIDFSKAFDTISHDTLMGSLHKNGFLKRLSKVVTQLP